VVYYYYYIFVPRAVFYFTVVWIYNRRASTRLIVRIILLSKRQRRTWRRYVSVSLCFSASLVTYYTVHCRLRGTHTHKIFPYFYHPTPLNTRKTQRPHLEKKLYKLFARDAYLVLTY
jgi:hypothetical protein